MDNAQSTKNKPDEMQGAFSLFSVSCRDFLNPFFQH